MSNKRGPNASGDEQTTDQTGDTLPGTPTDAFGCGATGCVERRRLRQVTDTNGRRRVLCPQCARAFASKNEAGGNA